MSFLSDYLVFNSGNEANINFHRWCGLAALSSIVSRRVWIDQGYFRIYCNLYIVLLAPPGTQRKTTAMSIAKKLVRDLQDIPFSAECQTKESLVKELQTYQRNFTITGSDKPYQYTPMSIFVTELSQFIGVDPARMIDFLTTVYDQDFYDLKTKNKGSEFIVGPYITMLACTTPDWITSYLKTDIITGGFSRRALFVLEYDDSSKRIAFPEITEDMRKAWDRLLQHAHLLFTVGGEFKWADDAKAYYIKWYETRTISKDPLVSGFDGTSFVQIIKVAMLIALSESTELILRKAHLEIAMALIDVLKVNLSRVFVGIGRNELNVVKQKMIQFLKATGPVTERKLLAVLYSDLPGGGRDFMTLLADMEKTEDIVRGKDTAGNVYVGLPEHRERMGLV